MKHYSCDFFGDTEKISQKLNENQKSRTKLWLKLTRNYFSKKNSFYIIWEEE